jgi:hypothetical protein
LKHSWIAMTLLLIACSPVRPPERNHGPARPSDTSELKELVDLSQLVVVGAVEVRKEEPGGTYYQVLLQEVLVGGRLSEAESRSHPAEPGAELRVTSFLYRPGEPAAAIRELRELSRYVFFLTPTERPGEWLNLTDPGAYALPGAQETVEQLRAQGSN